MSSISVVLVLIVVVVPATVRSPAITAFPATFILPLKLILPPVITVLEIQLEPKVLINALEIVTFVDTVFVFNNVPMVAVVTLALVICALGAVIPVDNVSVAAEIFVEIALVLSKVVICALGAVIPVDKLSVALETFVETAFVFNRLPIVDVVEVRFVICAEPATSKVLFGLVVPIPIFPDVKAILLEKLVHCEPGE